MIFKFHSKVASLMTSPESSGIWKSLFFKFKKVYSGGGSNRLFWKKRLFEEISLIFQNSPFPGRGRDFWKKESFLKVSFPEGVEFQKKKRKTFCQKSLFPEGVDFQKREISLLKSLFFPKNLVSRTGLVHLVYTQPVVWAKILEIIKHTQDFVVLIIAT